MCPILNFPQGGSSKWAHHLLVLWVLGILQWAVPEQAHPKRWVRKLASLSFPTDLLLSAQQFSLSSLSILQPLFHCSFYYLQLEVSGGVMIIF